MRHLSKSILTFVALLLAVTTPAFAAGNLTVTNGTLSNFSSSGVAWNTGMNVILNIELNATVGEINNLSSLLINFTGTANLSNVTAAFVYNDSDSDAIIDADELQMAGNSSLNPNLSHAVLSFTVNFTVPANTKRNVLVAFNITRTGFRFNTTGVQIASNASIRTSNPDSFDNITIASGSINSSVKVLMDMHANASVSPRIVDTNVSEQMLVYTLAPTSQNTTDRIKIAVPVGYTLVDVTDVYVGTTRYNRSFDGANGTEKVGVTRGTTEFNLSFTTPGPTNAVKVNFTVNTNLSAQSSVAFTSKVSGNGLNFVDPETYNQETNVTTAQIIQILSVGGNKTAALMNGTDYWEFTFRLNFTSNVSGMIQFRMGNWTSPAGTINLTNQTPPNTNNTQFFANLRMSNETIHTRAVNVTDNYNLTTGITFNVTAETTTSGGDRIKNIVLKMIIPNTAPVSSGWYTVYSMLFRSNPT